MDNVVGLRGKPVESDRRAVFLNWLAQEFDSYVEATGREPDALVIVFGGLKQEARPSWMIRGESEGGGTTMLALAQATLMHEIASPSGN